MTTVEKLSGSDKVRKLQNVLHAKAKEDPDRRFHALIDKVWRVDFLKEAWDSEIIREARSSLLFPSRAPFQQQTRKGVLAVLSLPDYSATLMTV